MPPSRVPLQDRFLILRENFCVLIKQRAQPRNTFFASITKLTGNILDNYYIYFVFIEF